MPDSLLGLRGGDSASGCRFRVILSGGQFDLCGAKFAGHIVEPGAELLRFGGDQARGQSGDFILMLRGSMAVLDLLNDMRPIDLIGHRFSG